MSGDSRKPITTPGEFQGKQTISLQWRADSPPFSFGVTKAQLILACIDEIKAFVAANPREGGGGRNNRPGPRRQDQPLTDRQDGPLGPSYQGRPGAGPMIDRAKAAQDALLGGHFEPDARPGAGATRRP